MEVRYTLLAEGPSDAALIPILNWGIRQRVTDAAIVSQFADFGHLRHPPRGLEERIARGIDLYPCNLLIIHRDADAQPPDYRYVEITAALNAAKAKLPAFPHHVCVVPIRMTEVWLLISESAIRHAASNPNGNTALHLPPINRLETQATPKQLLQRSLETASGLRGRNLKKFSASRAVYNIPNHITDFLPLRRLSAYQRFEADLAALYPVAAKQ